MAAVAPQVVDAPEVPHFFWMTPLLHTWPAAVTTQVPAVLPHVVTAPGEPQTSCRRDRRAVQLCLVGQWRAHQGMIERAQKPSPARHSTGSAW